MVLLEVARQILRAGDTYRRLVQSLRKPFRYRRNQRVVLFMTDRGQCEELAASTRRAEFCLYDQGLRADYPHQAV